MSEEERRKSYVTSRILIESNRILNPQFNDGVLHISGSQVEMLRNIVYYLDRPDTFVDEYHSGYYLMADNDDWDIISSIVDDLKEVLMGNNNIVFGYFEPLMESLAGVLESGTTYTKWSTYVQSGEVWVVQIVSITNKDNNPSLVKLLIDAVTTSWKIKQEASPGTFYPVVYSNTFVLNAGRRVGVVLDGCVIGDLFEGFVWGYKMQVPV